MPRLLHQQHLPGAFDGPVQAALVVGGQTGVFAGQDAALIGHELPEQVDVLEVEGVDGEVDFGLGPGRARSRTTRVRPWSRASVGVVFQWVLRGIVDVT